MKTIERYVFGSFLASFLLAFLVLSFVLTIAIMVKIVGYILDGVAMSLVGEFALVSFPETMQWTVPLALLVSSMLVFSRLSSDSEIAAMRACGVNLLSVMKWPAAFALACTVLAAWVNNEIVPRGHEVRRRLTTKVSVETGMNLLEPGRWNAIPNTSAKVYLRRKEGNWVYDLRVKDSSPTNGVERTITASKALVVSEGRDIVFNLYDATVEPVDVNVPGMARAGFYTYRKKDALKDAYKKKGKDLRFRELVEAIRGEKRGKERSKLKVELSKRFVFAMASLCFVLVGMPLGIRAQRKESSVGMAISLAVAIGYYLVAMLMLSLEKNRSVHPELVIWLPVVACLAFAGRLVRKNL